MKVEIVLSVVGIFGTIALTINGFFLKGIFSELVCLKVEFGKMFTRSEAKEKRLDDIEMNEKEIFDRLNILEREVLK